MIESNFKYVPYVPEPEDGVSYAKWQSAMAEVRDLTGLPEAEIHRAVLVSAQRTNQINAYPTLALKARLAVNYPGGVKRVIEDDAARENAIQFQGVSSLRRLDQNELTG